MLCWERRKVGEAGGGRVCRGKREGKQALVEEEPGRVGKFALEYLWAVHCFLKCLFIFAC